MQTPWGESESETVIAEGIVEYKTASHGGFKLSKKKNMGIPAYMREDDGFYEQDIAYCVVVVVYDFLFEPDSASLAMGILKHYYPDAFEWLYNTTVQPGESVMRDQANFYKANHDKLIARAGIPAGDGLIRAWAYLGGRLSPAREFLVAKEEFDAKGRFGFIIDPEKHMEVPSIIH